MFAFTKHQHSPTTSSIEIDYEYSHSRLYSTLEATRPRTRFDRLKKSYKGLVPTVETETIDFSYEDFAHAVKDTTYSFERDSVVEGMVVEHTPTGCLVDIGAKASAFLPNQEAALVLPENNDLSTLIPVDTPTDFQIISEEDENGQLIVSIKRLEYKKAWNSVQELAESDESVEAEVVSVNRGGAICLVNGLRAFLPGSHLTAGLFPDETLIGQSLKLKFLEVNNETGKLVVSHRKAIVEEQMADLSRGDLVNGIVKALKPYGAFIEVGGMSGLLHISQISHDRIDNLEEVMQIGMPIKCMIIDHDKVNGRIALATKSLEPEPGDMLKDPQAVFDKAEETAAAYHARMEAERQAREEAARDIVLGLGDSLDDGDDPLESVSDSLDSLLTE